MTDTTRVQVGRLAFRVEGEIWAAYYAKADTMEGATWLGSIKLTLVEDEGRKLAFMALMRSAVSDAMAGLFGVEPTWGDEKDAPEHERAGRA